VKNVPTHARTRIMPTGGVEPTEESLQVVRRASYRGIGSTITKELLAVDHTGSKRARATP
jgi:hypothetical protein